jgi:hypothetical protein
MNIHNYSVYPLDTDVCQTILSGVPILGTVGMRINPLVGVGSIAELSTATASSKFGIALSPESSVGESSDLAAVNTSDASAFDIATSRDFIVKTFLENPFLTGVMCHVGSQGMTVEAMAVGAQRIVQVANEIDRACASMNGETTARIKMIDIGGGLSVNYYGDEMTPTFAEYAAALSAAAPRLFTDPARTICTGTIKYSCREVSYLQPVVIFLIASHIRIRKGTLCENNGNCGLGRRCYRRAWINRPHHSHYSCRRRPVCENSLQRHQVL